MLYAFREEEEQPPPRRLRLPAHPRRHTREPSVPLCSKSKSSVPSIMHESTCDSRQGHGPHPRVPMVPLALWPQGGEDLSHLTP